MANEIFLVKFYNISRNFSIKIKIFHKNNKSQLLDSRIVNNIMKYFR